MKKYLTFPYLKWALWGIITLLWIEIFIESYQNDGFSWRIATRESGGLAWNLLMFTIFISLFQKLFPKITFFARCLPLRKHTGIFAFLVAFSHVIFVFFIFGGWEKSFLIIRTNISMIFGTLAFLFLLPVFITSTNWACKKMGFKAWKNVQRFTHFAFIFMVLHLAFLKFQRHSEIDYGAFVPLLIYSGGYAFLFYKKLKLNPV